MKPALLYTLAYLLVKLAASINGPRYRSLQARVVGIIDKTIPAGILLTSMTGVSSIKCGAACANLDECVSFTYNKRIRDCLLYALSLITCPARVEPTSGYKYYRFIGAAYNATYLGCYQDDLIIRDLDGCFQRFMEDNSKEICISYCYYLGYKYGGIQVGYACMCGNAFGKYGEQPDSACDTPCTGNSRENCGGPLKNAVYTTGN